jgi:hypothetical protein
MALCKKALFVFSPTLNMYFAEAKVITMVGSVSELVVVKTDVDQFMNGLVKRLQK